MGDPNINPGWDAFMGDDTNTGVIRLVASVAVFAAIGGTLFWLLGAT